MELPTAAGAVVIGGGIVGCRAADHLAKMLIVPLILASLVGVISREDMR